MTGDDVEAEFARFFDEEVAPTLQTLNAPFPFEHGPPPRIVDRLPLEKAWMLMVALLAVMMLLVLIEMATSIDLGFVPNGPQ